MAEEEGRDSERGESMTEERREKGGGVIGAHGRER